MVNLMTVGRSFRVYSSLHRCYEFVDIGRASMCEQYVSYLNASVSFMNSCEANFRFTLFM